MAFDDNNLTVLSRAGSLPPYSNFVPPYNVFRYETDVDALATVFDSEITYYFGTGENLRVGDLIIAHCTDGVAVARINGFTAYHGAWVERFEE